MVDSKSSKSSKYSGILANPNRDNNDCAVVAISLATNASYNRVAHLLAQMGRKPGKGTKNTAIHAAIKLLGYKSIPITCDARTIRSLEAELAFLPGTYLVFTIDHILCASDYKIHDWTDGRLHRITAIYQIVPSSSTSSSRSNN